LLFCAAGAIFKLKWNSEQVLNMKTHVEKKKKISEKKFQEILGFVMKEGVREILKFSQIRKVKKKKKKKFSF
jgi:hypothetical protein